MILQVGQTLLHYRIAEKIGQGGMGAVWRARDTTLDRDVAIKVLPEPLAHDPERLARFDREAKLLASLNHPGIAAIYGFHREADAAFLVMELAEGEDLSQRLARGPLPVDEALEIGRQIAEALEAAHERGVIHRDLKPANIKLTTGGKVKVLDFGLAKAMSPESVPGGPDPSFSPTMTSAGTRIGMILGTAAYMSPEQARGRPLDRRTDLWSFGCVMYECLTGAQLFRGETISDCVAAAEDEFEMMFARGWTDGLPVVPPTEARVMAMLEGTTRAPSDIVAAIPPNLDEITVEKVAISAVMAGCKPEYLPWVLTAIEAACNDEFNMHGILATTMPVGPVIVCSGPGTRAIGMNSGGNALGQGNRANLTIGRALQLVVRNFGGGRPGEVDRAAHGNPGKLSFCFAEADDTSPYGSLAVALGIEPGVDALTVFAGEGPQGFVDQLSREPESLAASMAMRLQAIQHPKLIMMFDAIVVMGPEHARVFADAGWDRERILAEVYAHLNRPGSDLVRGAHGIAEGVPEAFGDAEALPKFRPGGLMLTYAGGGAGLFSQIIAGWVNGDKGSKPVTRAVQY